MELLGVVKKIMQENQVSASFKTRELIVATDEQYPQQISVQFAQDKCAILDNYKVGDAVTVGINLRGREWTDPQGSVKYFNTIGGWSIKKT